MHRCTSSTAPFSRGLGRLTLCGSMSLHPVSTGAAMHLAGYRALGLDFTYIPFAVTDVEGATRGMRALGIRGLGVSMPYKQAVIPLLDEIDPVAARIGAVNTIVNEDGRLRGYNTDWIGAVRALEEVTRLGGARVLLLGAGGAARAVAFGLAERGATVTVANRDLEKARQLAAAVGGTAVPLDAGALSPEALSPEHSVLVNATSRGMAEVDPRSPVPEEALREDLLVMDIVYKPMVTELVEAARRRGASAVHGGRMLLHQAAEQFRLYTGHEPPLDAMDEALRAQLG
ncbi:shikimate dehydrogenase [Sorangium sp. So ce388]|uniref:shikimate dehydrogenase n=1 Tax=Sorangium sp. So ce388 TaxID=3133309 RepID=UPI003F5C38EB